MKNIILFFVFPFLSLFFAQRSEAQCYVRLEDASGFNTDPYQDSLQAAAAKLCAIFDTTGFAGQFKVYDFGFYLHQENTTGDYPEPFAQKIAQVQALSPYYLLFGKQTDNSGVYTKFWVDLVLPDTAQFSCMTEFQRVVYNKRVEKSTTDKYANKNNNFDAYNEAEIEGINELYNILNEINGCCLYRNGNRMMGCEGCSDEIVNFYFQLQGFEKINLGLFNAPFANIKSNHIRDYSFHKIIVGGQLDYVGNHLNTVISNFNTWFSVNLLATSNQSFCIDSIGGIGLENFKTQEDFLCQINFPSGQGTIPVDIKIFWNKTNSRIKDNETAQLIVNNLYCNINNALGLSNENCLSFDCDYAFGFAGYWGITNYPPPPDEISNGIEILNTWNGPYLLDGQPIAFTEYRFPFSLDGLVFPDDLTSQTNGSCVGVKNKCMTERLTGPPTGTPSIIPITESDRREHLYELIDFHSKGTLKEVGRSFVDKFLSEHGNLQNRDQCMATAMFNDELSNVVRHTSEMRNFMKRFGELFNTKLQEKEGNVNLIPEIEMGDIHPHFRSKADLCNGLTIIINNTSQTRVWYDNGFVLDAEGNWSADFFFEIVDHFGLDRTDLLSFQNKPISGDGFASWWVLQHRDGYRPFITRITMYATLKGKIEISP